MVEAVYILSSIMSIMCAVMLFRAYRVGPSHLLLWSCACFTLLAVNNIVLFIDVLILPELDFNGLMIRSLAGALAGSLLLFGLIWEIT